MPLETTASRRWGISSPTPPGLVTATAASRPHWSENGEAGDLPFGLLSPIKNWPLGSLRSPLLSALRR
jgi:hypothetical protein